MLEEYAILRQEKEQEQRRQRVRDTFFLSCECVELLPVHSSIFNITYGPVYDGCFFRTEILIYANLLYFRTRRNFRDS